MKSIDYIARALKYFFKKEAAITDKGFVKLVQGDKETTLHYIQSGSKLLALTEKESQKVKYIQNGVPAQLSFAKKDRTNSIAADVHVIEDQHKVKRVFEQMQELSFNHFKKYTDNLVILEMTMKSE